MATYTSTGSGNWSDSSKWSPTGVPGLTDLVRIASGHTITLDGAYTIGNETAVGGAWSNADLVVNGTLKYSRTVNAALTIRGVGYVSSTGTLDMGLVGDEIPGTITAQLLINGAASSPSPAKHRFLIDPGGRFLARSQWNRKRKVKLTAACASGQAVATLSSVRDWQVGDQVVFPPNSAVSTVGSFETLTIASIAGNNVTFTTNFAQSRVIGTSAVNVTSNIRVLPADGQANGGNFMFRFSNTSAADRFIVRDVLFGNCGVTDGAMGSNNVSGTASAPWSWAALGMDAQSSPSGLQVSQLESCVFYATSGTANSRQIVCLNGTIQSAYPVRDLAVVDLSTTAAALYISSSAQVDINEFVTLRCGGCVVVGYSFGCNGGTIKNASFCNNNASQSVISLGGGSGMLFEDCDGAGLGGLISASNHGRSIFRRCNFISPIALQGFVTNPYAFATGGICDLLFDECYPAPTQAPSNQLTAGEQSFMIFANAGGSPLSQFIYSRYGEVRRDDTTFRTAAPSLRVTPNSATKPLTLTFQIAAPTGKTVGISGFMNRTNAAIGAVVTLSGLNAATQSYTMVAGTGTWIPFSLNTMQTTGTDSYLTVTIQVTGTAGQLNIDDLAAFCPDPVYTGSFSIFADGKPVPFIISSAVSAADVWAAPVAANAIPGTKGGELNSAELFAILGGTK